MQYVDFIVQIIIRCNNLFSCLRNVWFQIFVSLLMLETIAMTTTTTKMQRLVSFVGFKADRVGPKFCFPHLFCVHCCVCICVRIDCVRIDPLLNISSQTQALIVRFAIVQSAKWRVIFPMSSTIISNYNI